MNAVIILAFDYNNAKNISESLNNFSYEILAVKKKSDEIVSDINLVWNDISADKFYIRYDEVSSSMYRVALLIDDLEEKVMALSKMGSDKKKLLGSIDSSEIGENGSSVSDV